MPRLKKRIRQFAGSCVLDIGGDQDAIFIAGTGRSGTTWVEELLNHRNEYRMMFEPFHSLNVDRLEHWHYKQYLRIDNDSDQFLEPAADILGGRIRHPWIDKYNHKYVARRRLIKDIRANLFLAWMKRHFPKIPIIFVLRHPCAVVNSRVKMKWDCPLGDLLNQPELMADYLGPFESEIAGATDPFDKHLFMWCIENYIPLRQFSPGEMLVVFYEHLCQNPRGEFERIMAFLGQQNSLPAAQNAANPSALSRKESAIHTGGDLIDSWRSHVTERQIERALEICGLFGLQAIYNAQSMPLVTGDEALNAFPPVGQPVC